MGSRDEDECWVGAELNRTPIVRRENFSTVVLTAAEEGLKYEAYHSSVLFTQTTLPKLYPRELQKVIFISKGIEINYSLKLDSRYSLCLYEVQYSVRKQKSTSDNFTRFLGHSSKS